MVSPVVVLASGAWIGAGWDWRVDLVANLTAQIGIVSMALLLCWATLRRWRLLLCVAMALPLQILALAPGRAPRCSTPDETIVRVLTFNAYSEDRSATHASRILDGSDADVFTIIEPGPDVIGLLRNDEAFRARRPFVWPASPGTAIPTIISRWPIEGLRLVGSPAEGGWPRPGIEPTVAIIHRPGGSFVLLAMHPPSPRSREAWEVGNASIDRLAMLVNDLAATTGLPIVVGGDFNTTPAGWRSRRLRGRTSLRRGKPWLAPAGTWPNGTVWPARLAIDDVFVSPTIRVLSWKSHPAPAGGDHSPVRIELCIPKVGPSAGPAVDPELDDEAAPGSTTDPGSPG